MKVTLIYTGISGIGFNSLGKYKAHDTHWMNLGLAYIGSYLQKNSYEVDLIDLREVCDWAEVREQLKQRMPDVVGIYFNTINFVYALECAKIARALNKYVVAGGPHATVRPDELIKTGFIDQVIVGEGEISMLELLHTLENGGHPPAIVYGKRIEDLDGLPFPDRDLYNTDKIIHSPFFFPFLEAGVTILGSRGCLYNCAFCQPTIRRLFGKGIRCRSVENVIEEIRYLVDRYKIKYFHFDDDTFTSRKEWALGLCEAIKEENFDIQWSAQCRVDTFDEEIAGALQQSGCVCLFFGFESGSQRILKLLRKGIRPEQSLRAAELCKKYGMIIIADYILGSPTETEKDLEETYQLIKKIRPEINFYSYFSPVPGSDLYDYCEKRGLILAKTYEEYDRHPHGKKIKGVDYNLIQKYQQKCVTCSPKWYEEKNFLRLALKRWLYFLKKGKVVLVCGEIFEKTFDISFTNMLRKTAKRIFVILGLKK